MSENEELTTTTTTTTTTTPKIKSQKNPLLIILSIGVIIGALISVFLLSISDKVIFKTLEMRITLTNEFHPEQHDGFTAVYSSEEVAVLIVKDDFKSVENLKNKSTKEYIELIINKSGIGSAKIDTYKGIPYLTYNNIDSSQNLNALLRGFAFKTSDAFWFVQFVTDSDKADEYTDEIYKWVESIKFSN